MKFITLVTALFLTVSANATSLVAEQTEVLPKVEMNDEPTNYTGRLMINYVEDRIEVQIYQDICGSMKPLKEGIFRCMVAPNLIAQMSVPLQERTTSCGSMVYFGAEDKTPSDGIMTAIRVVDNSTRLCRDLVRSTLVVTVATQDVHANIKTTYVLMK